MNPVLETHNLSVRYPNEEHTCLENINLSLTQGEVIWLTGASGCGKSTLLNCLSGMIPEILDAELTGTLELLGKRETPAYERSLHMGCVCQNPRSQFFTTNTTSELVFALENHGVDRALIRERMNEATRAFGLTPLLNREVDTLSSGERQLIALVCALMCQPNIVLFDEPSANLDYGNACKIGRDIARLTREGYTVVVADHRCFYLADVVDRVALIENGRLSIFDSMAAYLAARHCHRAINPFDEDLPKRTPRAYGKPVIELSHVSWNNIIFDASLTVRTGEVVGIVGVNGAGKTSLVRLICKLVRPTSGQVTTQEQPLYIMQDASYQLFGSSLTHELSLTCSNKQARTDALTSMGLWNKRTSHPQELSGGEQQRLQLACALTTDAPAVVLDEPTSGLDQASMQRVVNLVDELSKTRAVIAVSHDVEFLRRSCDRIVHVHAGRVYKDFELSAATTPEFRQIFEEMEEFYA